MRLNRSIGAICFMLVSSIPNARADVFSGAFSGIAENSRINALGPTPGNFDGSPVTGTFSLDFAAPSPTGGNNSATTATYAAILTLTFDAAGQHTSFSPMDGGNPGFVSLSVDPNGQTVLLSADYGYPVHFASLSLAGPDFFSGLDPSTLHPGPVNIASSSASFFDSRAFGADVVIDSVSFTGLSVPEPPGWIWYLSGLGGLMLTRSAIAPGGRRRQ